MPPLQGSAVNSDLTANVFADATGRFARNEDDVATSRLLIDDCQNDATSLFQKEPGAMPL